MLPSQVLTPQPTMNSSSDTTERRPWTDFLKDLLNPARWFRTSSQKQQTHVADSSAQPTMLPSKVLVSQTTKTKNYGATDIDPGPWFNMLQNVVNPTKTRRYQVLFIIIFTVLHIEILAIGIISLRIYYGTDNYSIQAHCPLPNTRLTSTDDVWPCDKVAWYMTTFFHLLELLVVFIAGTIQGVFMRGIFQQVWGRRGWEDNLVGRCYKWILGFPREAIVDEERGIRTEREVLVGVEGRRRAPRVVGRHASNNW